MQNPRYSKESRRKLRGILGGTPTGEPARSSARRDILIFSKGVGWSFVKELAIKPRPDYCGFFHHPVKETAVEPWFDG